MSKGVKFMIYDAKKTIEFRYKTSNNLLNISQIMVLIDDDHIPIHEEKCIKKNLELVKNIKYPYLHSINDLIIDLLK